MTEKKRVNSKKKGSSFEADIAEVMTDIWERAEGEKVQFRRTPHSGAGFGGVNKIIWASMPDEAKEFMTGDVFGPVNMPFIIECKFYKEDEWSKLLQNPEKTNIHEWVRHAYLDVVGINKKYFILFMKFNNRGIFVATNFDAGKDRGQPIITWDVEAYEVGDNAKVMINVTIASLETARDDIENMITTWRRVGPDPSQVTQEKLNERAAST